MVEQGQRRILVADDEATFRDATAALLEREGYLCDTCSRAEEAIQQLQQARYDLLIADIRMPGNENLELIEAVNRLPYRVPVILITGYPAIDTAIRAVSLPVSAYLTKPIRFAEILPHVRQAMQRATNMNTVVSFKEQLQRWYEDLRAIEEGLYEDHAAPPSEYMLAFLHLTLNNINQTMTQLRGATEAFASADPALSKRVALNRSIEEAIEVLERSKKVFKSKELADLRVRLEAVRHLD